MSALCWQYLPGGTGVIYPKTEARLAKLDPPPPANRVEVFQQPVTGKWLYSLYLNNVCEGYNAGAYETKAEARKAAQDHHKRLTKPEIEVIPL